MGTSSQQTTGCPVVTDPAREGQAGCYGCSSTSWQTGLSCPPLQLPPPSLRGFFFLPQHHQQQNPCASNSRDNGGPLALPEPTSPSSSPPLAQQAALPGIHLLGRQWACPGCHAVTSPQPCCHLPTRHAGAGQWQCPGGAEAVGVRGGQQRCPLCQQRLRQLPSRHTNASLSPWSCSVGPATSMSLQLPGQPCPS